MKATIVNFRRGRHVQTNNQMVLTLDGVDSKDKAAGLVGKAVTWTSPAGKALTGKITAAHGNKGAVRVLFNTGMPGQSVGAQVEVQ